MDRQAERSLLATLIAALAAAGCSSDRGDRPVQREVAAADFRMAGVDDSITPQARPRGAAADPTDANERALVVIGPPDRPGEGQPAAAAGKPAVIDRMVGQINGKPIYADEFFQEMDTRLREEAASEPRRQWLRDVRADVQRKLWDETRDELLLAEFQTSLSPEQRMGVLAFIQDIQDNLETMAGGSSEVANKRLQEEEGVSLREKVESVAERQFIIEQLRRTISNRVQVSFRDIRQYYEHNYDKFQPPPIAVFRVIRLPIADTLRIDRVESQLATGESFVEIAEVESDWARDNGARHEVTIEDRVYAEQDYFAGPLNELTQALVVGESTDRIDHLRSVWWIYLEEIRVPAGQSLYEAQVQIENGIREERAREEERRYFATLLQRSNVSDFDTMVLELVKYASERYLDDARPARGAG